MVSAVEWGQWVFILICTIMSYARSLIRQQNLQAGDVVVVGFGLGLISHYLVYMGHDGYDHYFVANVEEGVKYFRPEELDRKASGAHLKRIRRFEGSYHERNAALQRAHGIIGKAYSYLQFNCESAANLIQYGRARSHQVEKGVAIAGLTLVGLLLWGLSGNDDAQDNRRRS